MIESSEEKSVEFDSPTEGSNKPLVWFFIVMLLLNPFLAPLLAVLLKPTPEPRVTVVDDKPPEEPEIPSDFFEPDFFQRINRFFSFPMASAESLPQSHLYTFYPEFLTGTTKHDANTAALMEKNIQEILPPLHHFLLANRNAAEIVIGIAENHLESFYPLISLIAILKEWQTLYPTTKIIFIQEFIAPAENLQQSENELQAAFSHIHSTHSAAEKADTYFDSRCFNSMFKHNPMMRLFSLKYCLALAVKSRQFDFVLTRSTPLTKQQDAFIHRYRNRQTQKVHLAVLNNDRIEPFNDDGVFLPHIHQADQAIINTLKTERSKHKKDKTATQKIFVPLLGSGHALTIDAALKDMQLPYHFFHIEAQPRAMNSTRYFELFAQSCLLPLKDCPEKVRKRTQVDPQLQKASHCVLLDEVYDDKKCEKTLHETYTERTRRMAFTAGLPHKVSPTLPSQYPNNIHAFFLPKKLVESIQQTLTRTHRQEL